MSGVNKVIIVGRLGNDPEVKTLNGGQTVATMSIATSEAWVGKDGQKQEKTEWHRVVAWGKQAETLGKYMKKGRQIYIEGKLQTRSWEDNGQKRYATEIVAQGFQFLGDGGARTDNSGGGQGYEPAYDTGEEIPF